MERGSFMSEEYLITQEEKQRIRIEDNENSPYSRLKTPYKYIGLISFKDKRYNKTYIGTGTLIAPNLVLTVAHNVYDNRQDYHFEDITFQLQVNNKLENHRVIDYRFPKEYKKLGKEDSIEYDYALVKIQTKDGPYKEYMQICTNYTFRQEEIGVFGYHQTDITEKVKIIQSGFWKMNCRPIDPKNPYIIYHGISTRTGISGAPILINRNGKYFIIGIHKGKKLNQNRGRLIEKNVSKSLVKWQHQMINYSIKLNIFGYKKLGDKLIDKRLEITTQYNKQKNALEFDQFLDQKMTSQNNDMENFMNIKEAFELNNQSHNKIEIVAENFFYLNNRLKSDVFQKKQSTLVLIVKLKGNRLFIQPYALSQSQHVSYLLFSVIKDPFSWYSEYNLEVVPILSSVSPLLYQQVMTILCLGVYICTCRAYMSVYLGTQCCNVHLIKEEFANYVSEFVNLRKILLFLNFPLLDKFSYSFLAKILNKLALKQITITIDPQYRQKEQDNNWFTKIKQSEDKQKKLNYYKWPLK